jgi:hypothetical protein
MTIPHDCAWTPCAPGRPQVDAELHARVATAALLTRGREDRVSDFGLRTANRTSVAAHAGSVRGS